MVIEAPFLDGLADFGMRPGRQLTAPSSLSSLVEDVRIKSFTGLLHVPTNGTLSLCNVFTCYDTRKQAAGIQGHLKRKTTDQFRYCDHVVSHLLGDRFKTSLQDGRCVLRNAITRATLQGCR